MASKFICSIPTEDLRRAYLEEGKTLEQMCEYIGVKNTITASKILREHGIETNKNKRLAEKTRCGLSEEEFENYVKTEYASGRTMKSIADEFHVTQAVIRKHLIRYGVIPRKSSDYYVDKPFANPNWRGGRREAENGYVAIYCPTHPNSSKRKTVYEHQLVMEEYIGRYLQPGEIVHHIDGDKKNNSIENLLLMTSSDHMKLHAILRRSSKLMEDLHAQSESNKNSGSVHSS